ncbi:MAG TPA: phosphate ABC transporter permease subunit PstC [Actinomycetota bacterium]|jgi:phosphate transport system permease protein|nr:phosphate ABC transporter permease subunit PstC [Actinomycetota bacterium]
MASGPTEENFSLASLRGERGRMRKESVIRAAFLGTAALSIVISALIVLTLARETFTFVTQVDLSSLWSEGWFPRRDLYDIRTLFVGSVLVTLIGMLVAAPLGMGAAVFLAEYAKPKVRRVLKPILEILAGIPSVVLGFFALTWISPQIVQRMNEEAALFNLMAAGIGVGLLVTPLVASIAEDAMKAVPKALREASYGMGARKVTTSIRVVIPASVSGLVAAFIIGISRAIGETMVVAIAAGASGGSLFSMNVFDRGQTMTAAMASMAGGTDAVKGAGLTFQSLFFVGMMLFLMTLLLNTFAGRFVRRVRQKY